MELQELVDLQEHQVQQVLQELVVHLVLQAAQELQEQQVLQELVVQVELQVHQ